MAGTAAGAPGPVGPLRSAACGSLAEHQRRGRLHPGRGPGAAYRVYDEAELRAAHGVARLRRGGYPFPIIETVVGELRTTGSPERVRAELARREHELQRRSVRRLGASAALYAYLRRRGLVGQ